MKHTFRKVHHHLKKHHKKYLFWLFGGYAIVKLVLLVLGLSAVQYLHVSTFAQLESGCLMTGQYYTGEYQTGCIEVPEEITGGYLIDCQTIPGYFTGGTLNESGELVDQIRVEESQTWCVLTGQTTIPAYTTWCFMTWGYRTGGTLLCETWTIQTGIEQTWTIQQQTITLWNGICESGDVLWSKPLSWNSVRDGIIVQWAYSGSDCVSWLSLQLRDHNNQWIGLSTIASGITSYAFDTRRLYGFQYSGLYHIIGNTGAGNFMLYSGQYSWSYSRFFSWYKLRLLAPDQSVIHETWPFTIDNQYPTLSWLTLTSSWSATGYITANRSVVLSFVASELLDDVDVTLWGKHYASSSHTWLLYTYTWNVNSLYPEGVLAAAISFDDAADNSWTILFTWSLILDMTRPTLTWMVFGESSEWLLLDFVSSEPINYTLNYRKTGGTYASGKNTSYLTAHQALFTWIERNQLYAFTLDVIDQAGNSRAVTWEVTWTNLGKIVSTIFVVPATGDQLLTGNLSTLAVTLKKEVEKFNACKDVLSYSPIVVEVRRNDYTIHMPKFKKSQVKTLVNAFTLFVLDEIKGDYKITKSDIEQITNKFDNFLVILKLLRDDDNSCKQNLSNYHISQFEQVLEKYDIHID